jgi:iron complex outermembrane receptor protein
MTDALSTAVQLSYIDATFDEFVTYDPVTGTRRDLASQRGFQNTPKVAGSVSLTYRHALAQGGNIAFTPAVAYRDKFQMFEIPLPALDQKSYTLVNASLVWTSADDRWSLGLHGQNLTDEQYRVGAYNFPGATFGNVVSGFYGPPRTVTLTWRYKSN